MKGKKIITIVLALLLVLAAAGGAVFYFIFQNGSYVSDEKIRKEFAEAAKKYPEENPETNLSDEEQEAMREQINTGELPKVQSKMDGIYNVLLIGSDRRDDTWNGNSDCMILVTFNEHAKKIFLTSFMRDLYADIPGIGVRKLNAAFANGGGPLLVDTLESNYGVSIDNYVSVDFSSTANIIDLIGGVDVTVHPEEVVTANDYITCLCEEQDKNANDYYIPAEGLDHLNGIQALAFSRIRYVGNADFERTSRQREVLQGAFNSVKKMNILDLTGMIGDVMKIVKHNISTAKMFELITKVPEYLTYQIEEVRIPYDNEYTISNEILVPTDMNATITRLQNTIYTTQTAAE